MFIRLSSLQVLEDHAVMVKALSAEDAAASLRGAGLEPLEPYRNVETPWRSRCMKCGAKVSPRLHSIRSGWGGCRRCAVAARVLTQRERDADRAMADMLQANLQPLVSFVSTKTRWLCRCLTCGNEVTPMLNNIRNNHGGCIHCGGKAPVDPRVAVSDMRDAGLEPLEQYSTALTPWRCRCMNCHREVIVRLAGVRSGNAACLFCDRSGFALRGPGLLYLLSHDKFQAHKIGVTSPASVRLPRHWKRGWKTFKQATFTHYTDAYHVEQSVLRRLWVELNIQPFLSPQEMPSGGWTETISASSISLSQLWRVVLQETVRVRRTPREAQSPRITSRSTRRCANGSTLPPLSLSRCRTHRTMPDNRHLSLINDLA